MYIIKDARYKTNQVKRVQIEEFTGLKWPRDTKVYILLGEEFQAVRS